MRHQRLFSIITLLTLVCALSFAQKEEINAFEKQNKALIKQLKKDFDAKVAVKLADNGAFYLVLTKKVGKTERYRLHDESGAPIYDGELDRYIEIKGGSFFIGEYQNGQLRWGAIRGNGQMVLPIQFHSINHNPAHPAGTYTYQASTYWHPANDEVWYTTTPGANGMPAHHTFYSPDGKQVTHEYDGKLEAYKDFYRMIKPEKALPYANKTGLLTLDGKVIYPQEYWSYFVSSTGMVKCIKADPDGLLHYGGKMLDSSISTIEIPAQFYSVLYSESTKKFRYQLHRDDDFATYDPSVTYTVEYKDEGQRLYDAGKYQKVITYYEGEGFGKAWGDYFMGLSAKAIADAEQLKMDNCIKTLKSNTNYYLPIKNPEKYKFEAGTIAGMYGQSGIYLGKFLSNNDIPEDDPAKARARVMRGQVVTASNSMSAKLEEYGAALRAATIKNTQREQAIAEENARRQAAANQLANGLTNLLLGGKKK